MAAAQSKKAKISKATAKVPTKDSAEIDDLFSVLSTKKSAVTVAKAGKDDAKKEEKKKLATGDEVTLSDLEGLDEEEDRVEVESAEESDADLARGTAFDPKKDDQFPVSTPAATAAPDRSDFFDSRGLKRKTRALTEDGFPIFSPKELKIGMGGGTDLCPFDCNCCY